MMRTVNIVATTSHNSGRTVTIDGRPLPLCPGYTTTTDQSRNWGTADYRAVNLARDILAAVLGDTVVAEMLALDYGITFVAGIQVENWTLPSSEVLAWVEGHPDRAAWLGRN